MSKKHIKALNSLAKRKKHGISKTKCFSMSVERARSIRSEV